MTQLGHRPSGPAPLGMGESHEPKIPIGGAESGLSPPAPVPVPTQLPLSIGAALSAEGLSLPKLLSASADRMGPTPWGCPGWEPGMGLWDVQLCLPGSRTTAPAAGSPQGPLAARQLSVPRASLFTGAAAGNELYSIHLLASRNPGQTGRGGRGSAKGREWPPASPPSPAGAIPRAWGSTWRPAAPGPWTPARQRDPQLPRHRVGLGCYSSSVTPV